jgi:hypothetical protein
MKLKPFKEFTSEMSTAMIGDWKDDEPDFTLGTMSKIVTDTQWREVLGTIVIRSQVLELRKLRGQNQYSIGHFTNDDSLEHQHNPYRFKVICQINLGRNRTLENLLKRNSESYSRIVNVDGIYIDPEYRGFNIASDLYKWLVNDQKFTILGDKQQYFGARKLWSKLSKDRHFKVDIIDIYTGNILFTDVDLYHGQLETEIDNRLWTMFPDNTMSHIRPILTKID